MVNISFYLWTCPTINWVRCLLFPVIVFDGNIQRRSLIECLWCYIMQRIYVPYISCVSNIFYMVCFRIQFYKYHLKLVMSYIRSDGTVSVFMWVSIWSKPYLQYYLMSDHRSYLRIWRSCPLRSTQYHPHRHHLHCHQAFSIIIAVSALQIAWTLESTRASLLTPLSYYLY